MKKTIKIGVSAAMIHPSLIKDDKRKKRFCFYTNDMGNYLAKDNVMPILIPELNGNALYNFMDRLDGFLFQGGIDDVAPERYNEKPLNAKKWPGDKVRDAFEFKVLEFALKKEKPVMAICRGHQLLNVFFGGTLYQDIPTQFKTEIIHDDPEIYSNINHKIKLAPGTFFEEKHRSNPCRSVNSIHHQAIKELGKDLETLATSEDGLIEAIHWTGSVPGKVMGMQWHPEYFHDSNTPLISKDIVYDHFLSFC